MIMPANELAGKWQHHNDIIIQQQSCSPLNFWIKSCSPMIPQRFFFKENVIEGRDILVLLDTAVMTCSAHYLENYITGLFFFFFFWSKKLT